MQPSSRLSLKDIILWAASSLSLCISNKTVELSLVSQSTISKYSLTTHIGEDLEVCLRLDIERNGRHARDTLSAGGAEQTANSLKPQIHQIWRETGQCFCLILNGLDRLRASVSLCVYVCVLEQIQSVSVKIKKSQFVSFDNALVVN